MCGKVKNPKNFESLYYKVDAVMEKGEGGSGQK